MIRITKILSGFCVYECTRDELVDQIIVKVQYREGNTSDKIGYILITDTDQTDIKWVIQSSWLVPDIRCLNPRFIYLRKSDIITEIEIKLILKNTYRDVNRNSDGINYYKTR